MAFVLGGNLMVGGLTAGVVTAILVAILARISGCARFGHRYFLRRLFALGIAIPWRRAIQGSVQKFSSIIGCFE